MLVRTRVRGRRAAALQCTAVLGAVWIGKLVQLRRSVGGYAVYWSRPRGRAGGLLYVALGDSAAQSIGASLPDRGYVALLARRLGDVTGRPVEVVNLSRAGARLADVVEEQVPALAALGRAPDLVTVAIGGNDLVAYDRALYAVQVDRLVDALPSGAYVADAPYFMHGRWERGAQDAADLLTAVATRHGLRPVALHDTQRARGWQAMLTDFAADWFHPNDRGHRVWADAFWQRIVREVAPVAVPDDTRRTYRELEAGRGLPFDGRPSRS